MYIKKGVKCPHTIISNDAAVGDEHCLTKCKGFIDADTDGLIHCRCLWLYHMGKEQYGAESI